LKAFVFNKVKSTLRKKRLIEKATDLRRRIDLLAFPRGCNPFKLACDKCEGVIVGFEVKTGRVRLMKNDLKVLEDYKTVTS